ncbi:MAG: DUF1640 domain-containing protein [Magnetococcales bacterium]|nr:DUF1640 domain-containing protein [Magnetococcales bacterium]
MLAITFDTHTFIKKMRAAGLSEPQAEAQAEAIRDAFAPTIEGLATKQDLQIQIESLRRDMKEMELRIAAEIAPLRWGMAVSVATSLAIALKLFMPGH